MRGAGYFRSAAWCPEVMDKCVTFHAVMSMIAGIGTLGPILQAGLVTPWRCCF